MLWPEMADGSTVAQLDVLFVLLASLTLIHAVYRRGALSGTAAVFFLLAHTAFFEHVSLFLGGTHCHATSPLLPMVTPCSSVNSLLFYAPWIYTSLEAARRLEELDTAWFTEHDTTKQEVAGYATGDSLEQAITLAEDAVKKLGKATLSPPTTKLLAQCVAYGIKGSMAPHVDASVTRSKPLVVLSFGLDCVFRAGASKLRLRSGDAVLLDAATTLHGVDAIIAGTAAQNVRVSLMFYAAPPPCERGDDGALDGAAALFDDDSDDGEDDYAVLLFYKYARWRDRDAFRAAQEATCRSLQLCGRLRIAEDGLNGTLGGPRAALEAYIQETRRQAAGQGVSMDDVDWKWGAADAARPLEAQKLQKLSVKACREVVAFSDCGGVDEAAIGAPPARKVDAAEFHSVLESGGAGVVLVDVRNVYERRVGRFEAPGVRDADLQLRQFSDLPRALDDGALDKAETILMSVSYTHLTLPTILLV